jgi:hypothetical protein
MPAAKRGGFSFPFRQQSVGDQSLGRERSFVAQCSWLRRLVEASRTPVFGETAGLIVCKRCISDAEGDLIARHDDDGIVPLG